MLRLACALLVVVWSCVLIVGSFGDTTIPPPQVPLSIQFARPDDQLPIIFQVLPTLNSTEADNYGKDICEYLLTNQMIPSSMATRCFMKIRLLQSTLNPQILKMIVLSITNAASLFVLFLSDLNNLEEWNAEIRLNVHMNRDSLTRVLAVDAELSAEDMEAHYVDRIRSLLPQIMSDQTTLDEQLLFPDFTPAEFIKPLDPAVSGNEEFNRIILNGVRYVRENVEMTMGADSSYGQYRPIFKYYDAMVNSRNHALLAQHAHPWSFVILDDILEAASIRKVSQEMDHFAKQRHDSFLNNWVIFFDRQQYKYSQSLYHAYGPETRRVLNELKAAPFVRYLERITGIAGLIADPFDKGAGMHVIEPGGYLDVHLDFPFHDHIKVFRRVNVLLYVNDEDWEDDWGSHLELWSPLTQLEKQSKTPSPTQPTAKLDQFTQAMQFQHGSKGNGHGVYSFRYEDLSVDSVNDVTEDPRQPGEYLGKTHAIVPRFNRMVVLVLSNESYHGHPQTLLCPENRLRKSLAQYYYTSNAQVSPKLLAQSTLFVAAKP